MSNWLVGHANALAIRLQLWLALAMQLPHHEPHPSCPRLRAD